MPPRKTTKTDEQIAYEAYLEELEVHLAKTIVPALLERDDVVSVIVPKPLGMKAPRGALLIGMADGTSLKARFRIDAAFTVE